MKIGLRILLSYFLILGLSAWFVLNVFVAEVKPGVRSTLEDTLVDTANLLAQLVAEDVSNGDISQAKLLVRMQNFANHSINASISNVQKQNLDYRIIITNDVGIVIFDSEKKDIGKDFSRWNDVYLTLRGKYGARSTRTDPLDDNSSVMHVAAPIMDSKDSSKIIGVLTVAKPISTIGPFIERSQKKIMQRSFWVLLASLFIGIGFTWWLTRSLQHLQIYATKVQNNEKASLPDLGNNEIGELGKALESMRHQLEGSAYVEQLMHTLAHELKSPIAAIQGSAELLKEEMSSNDRERFLNNIIEQNQRQKQLIEKLLDLVKIEKQQSLHQKTRIHLPTLLDQIQTDTAANLNNNNIKMTVDNQTEFLQGDALLLRQAIDNLIDNAIAFSPEKSEIQLNIQSDDTRIKISIIDQGSGIPSYAEDKIFDRFYSLPRQHSGKSTGLGLPFVKEVALLHGGTITVCNQINKTGTIATLELPI